MSIECKDNMLVSRQTDHVEIRENNATVVGGSTRTNRIVQPEGRLATRVIRQTTLLKILLQKQHKQWGEFKKSGGKPKYNNSGKLVHQMDHTHDEDHDLCRWSLCLWSLYHNEVNSVNKPLVTITIENSPMKFLVDKRSSVNLLDEKTFQRLKQHPKLTKKTQPCDPLCWEPDEFSFLGNFDAEIKGNQRAVRSTVYVTGEGKGNLLSYETAMQLGYIPKTGEVNKVGETPPVNTTDRYSKLCEEYNDIFEGIGKLKGVQVKLHIAETKAKCYPNNATMNLESNQHQ